MSVSVRENVMKSNQKFFAILAVIAVSEFAVMQAFYLFNIPEGSHKGLLDAFLLTFFLSPII